MNLFHVADFVTHNLVSRLSSFADVWGQIRLILVISVFANHQALEEFEELSREGYVVDVRRVLVS